MKENTIRVLIVPPNELAYEKDIPNTLEAMQNTVGGMIEPFYYYDDVCLICNEEGKVDRLPLSRAIRDENGNIVEAIAGTFFICEASGEHFVSLSPEKMEKYKKLFFMPEKFLLIKKQLYAVPYTPTPKTGRPHER